MVYNKVMKKNGRPKIKVDLETAEKLAALHCTGEEIASVLKISYDTLVRCINETDGTGFAEWFKKHSASGKVSLRRAQYKSAMGGNVPMLIWLGKQYLGQTDKIEQNKDQIIISADIISALNSKKEGKNG